MLIKAAINGGRAKTEHPSIPVSPGEIAAAVVECLDAGASAIHFHIRSEDGQESLAGEDLAQTLEAVRKLAPTAPVGVSTGAWIVPDPQLRMNAISSWTTLPDFASVNICEEGAYDVAELLLQKGVGVEAGLCDARDVELLVNSGLADRCLRVLLEPQEQEIEKARATVKETMALLDQARIDIPRVLHGTEATTWAILEDAIKLGYGIRVGFEDTLALADGRVAGSNAELVKEAMRYVTGESAAGTS
jgi:uncharacterized protein (DUF849 family)